MLRNQKNQEERPLGRTEQDILGIGSKLNSAYLYARKGIQAKPTIDSLLQKGLKNT
jgi:hypothetical protein